LLWSTNNIIPAQEHFSSYIIQNRIIAETEKIPWTHNQSDIVLICPEGEFHELPLLFINYLFKKNGWSTLYLGENISKLEIINVVAKQPKWIYLHLITNFTGVSVEDYIEDICLSFPDKKIIASGGGITDVQRTYVNFQLLKTDKEIRDFISRKGEHDF